MHLGHRALINHCSSLLAQGDDLAVVTFEPLPKAFFAPEHAPARLSPPGEKLKLLEEAGVDLVWQMRFDLALAVLEPRAFVELVLVKGLAARHVVTGDDFRFGRDRAGNLAQLRQLGGKFGFETHVVEGLHMDGQRVSSGTIRQALAAGDFALAARLLGRPYRMSGRVSRGQQLGRKLGYPTANLRVKALPSPVEGIFAVRARVPGDTWRPAVASLGWRPTVGGEDLLLEVHFFDYDASLYGQRLEVEFVAKLRDESHFRHIDGLVEQMKRDEEEARAILGAPTRKQ